MTQQSVDGFLEAQRAQGASRDVLRQRKGFVTNLFCWLPEDKVLTKERLEAWRMALGEKGYSRQTVQNYIKGVNLYLDYMGWSEIRFHKGRAKDIRDLQFGYLRPVEPTGIREKGYVVWRCQCKCGNTVELPATRLLLGNTLSCGCMKSENILAASKTIGGTQLVKSLKEDGKKPDTSSGYTGVSRKGDKWCAHITYRRRRYYLGTYGRIEDAVKARARAKELVMEDARELLKAYELLHRDDHRPDRAELPKVETEALRDDKEKTGFLTVARSDSSSGYPGVTRNRNRWRASISYEGKRYSLGLYREKEEAIAARKQAEKRLLEDPGAFVAAVGAEPGKRAPAAPGR